MHGLLGRRNAHVVSDGARRSNHVCGAVVRLFELENSRPSDMQKELDSVFKAYALSDKSQSVKFLAVDRINMLIAVAPNPGIFPLPIPRTP